MIAAIVLLGAAFILVLVIVIIRRRGAATAGPVVHGAGFRVQAGLDVVYADGGVKQFRISSARTTIGRGPDNILVLRDEQISTHHAEILASPDGFLLRDLGSANGTTVNGQPATDVNLRIGDEIGIGTTRLTFTQ
jgi:pSer/pThr/pTyr-binding forkhead associated (FHA) protein